MVSSYEDLLRDLDRLDERVGLLVLTIYFVLIGAANGPVFLVPVSSQQLVQAWVVLNVEDNESDLIFSKSVL